MASSEKETATAKNKVMREVDIIVSEVICDTYDNLVSSGVVTPQPEKVSLVILCKWVQEPS